MDQIFLIEKLSRQKREMGDITARLVTKAPPEVATSKNMQSDILMVYPTPVSSVRKRSGLDKVYACIFFIIKNNILSIPNY